MYDDTLWVAFLKHCMVLLGRRPLFSDDILCIKEKQEAQSGLMHLSLFLMGDILLMTQIHLLIEVVFKTYQVSDMFGNAWKHNKINRHQMS